MKRNPSHINKNTWKECWTSVSVTTSLHSSGTAVNRIKTIIKSTINTNITAVVYWKIHSEMKFVGVQNHNKQGFKKNNNTFVPDTIESWCCASCANQVLVTLRFFFILYTTCNADSALNCPKGQMWGDTRLSYEWPTTGYSMLSIPSWDWKEKNRLSRQCLA